MRVQNRRDRDYTADKYFYLLLGISIVIALIFKDTLFQYFMFRDVIFEGDIFNYIYWSLMIIMSIWSVEACVKQESLYHFVFAGVTPAMAVLTIRWFLAGFVIAKIIIVIFAIYITIIIVQLLKQVVRKREIFSLFLQAVYKSSSVLTVLSIIGALGFWTSGFVYEEPIVEFEEKVSSVDRGWEYNTEMLCMWREGAYADLEDEEKKQLWQALVDMESNYFGIDPPTVEIEIYDSNSSYAGYYNKQYNIISVGDSALEYPRERVLNILLHEVNHAYTRAIADSVEWKDIDDSDRQLRMYVDAYAYKEAEINYTSIEEDEEGYFNNALEKAARNYAEEWGPKYLQYIDEL